MKRIFFPSILLALVLGGAIWFMNGENRKTQAQVGCSGAAPLGTDIRYQTATGRTPTITQSGAFQTASANATFDVSGAQFTNTQFVLFSDDERGTAASIGDDASVQLDYQNVPAWVITFCGVNVPIFTPFDSPLGQNGSAQTHEWNVVINADTGVVMEEYSFR